jgi:small GTP-binding protein
MRPRVSHHTNILYCIHVLQIEDTAMRLQLWDTAGQERFRSLTSNFFGRADGFCLTYDISNRPSFDHVIGWMRDIKTRAPPDCDIVLCGNKSDLDNDRVVSYDEGKQLAEEYGVQFFETSALTGHNVEKMFTALATTIKRKRIDSAMPNSNRSQLTQQEGGGKGGGHTVDLNGTTGKEGKRPAGVASTASSCCQ